MADVERTFETYDIDVLGVTETGTQKKHSGIFKSSVVSGLAKRGLHCVWGMPDPFQQSLGVMLIHRKGVSMKELIVDGSRSGRVVAGELTTWDSTLSKEVKTVVDDKAKYTDWSQRADIKAELKVDLIMLLAKHDYPPVDKDEVYKEIFEQAENFKKYQGE